MKHLGIVLVGILAVIGGAAFAALLIRKKLNRETDIEFDEDYTDDESFEDFYGDDEYLDGDVEEPIEDIDEDNTLDDESIDSADGLQI